MLFFNSIKIKFVVTFIVASVTGSALIRRFRLFLGQCVYYVPGYFLKVLVVLTAPDQDTQHSQTVRLVQRLPSITVLHIYKHIIIAFLLKRTFTGLACPV